MTQALTARLGPVRPWLGVGARLVLAGVLVYAAVTKVGDPQQTVRAVRAYQLLPNGLETALGYALPWFELALAALLLAGFALRLAGWVTAGLFLVFVAGISSAWARGLKIDCGCFGGGGKTENPQYVQELLRDGGLLLVAVLVIVLPVTRWALDPAPVPVVADLPADASRSAQRAHRIAAVRFGERTRARQVRLRVHAASAVALLLVSSLIGIAVGHASEPSKRSGEPRGANSRGGILVGDRGAKHLLVVYEDPQCPVCKTFETTSGSVLQAAVAAGAVRVEYRMRSFLGPESVRAVAALGAAADAGRFEQLREQLYAHQPKEQTGGFTVDDLIALGAAAGLDSPAFVAAVRDQRYAAWARRTDERASLDGNVGTPDLILDGRPVPLSIAFDPPRFQSLLQQ